MERVGNAVNSDDGNAVDSDEEEDEDYVADRDDAGSPTGDTEEDGSDSDASEDGDEEKPVKEKQKESVAPKPAAASKKKREEGEDDGREKKKKKKKKDPNAPKRALSTFMYFSQAEREVLKEKKPGLTFQEVGRIIGDKWKKLSEEEKEPYEKRSRLDKARYSKEMAEYKSGKQRAGGGSSGEESD